MPSYELIKIAQHFSLEQTEQCIDQQIAKGDNTCNIIDETDKVIAELSKATVIRELMDLGMIFSQALRELGRRIRAVYSAEDHH